MAIIIKTIEDLDNLDAQSQGVMYRYFVDREPAKKILETQDLEIRLGGRRGMTVSAIDRPQPEVPNANQLAESVQDKQTGWFVNLSLPKWEISDEFVSYLCHVTGAKVDKQSIYDLLGYGWVYFCDDGTLRVYTTKDEGDKNMEGREEYRFNRQISYSYEIVKHKTEAEREIELIEASILELQEKLIALKTNK